MAWSWQPNKITIETADVDAARRIVGADRVNQQLLDCGVLGKKWFVQSYSTSGSIGTELRLVIAMQQVVESPGPPALSGVDFWA